MRNQNGRSSCVAHKSMHRTVTLITILLLNSACAIFGPSEGEQQFWERMESFVDGHMNQAGSGIGILVIHDQQAVFARGWGMANIETGISFSPDTPCAIASLTKQFTATAVLMLYERDVLALETRLVSILPELPSQWSEITIHHLQSFVIGDEPVPEAGG